MAGLSAWELTNGADCIDTLPTPEVMIAECRLNWMVKRIGPPESSQTKIS